MSEPKFDPMHDAGQAMEVLNAEIEHARKCMELAGEVLATLTLDRNREHLGERLLPLVDGWGERWHKLLGDKAREHAKRIKMPPAADAEGSAEWQSGKNAGTTSKLHVGRGEGPAEPARESAAPLVSESERRCPECGGVNVITDGGGGPFCVTCDKRLPG